MKDVADCFGIPGSTVAARAAVLLREGGFEPSRIGAVVLGSTAYLDSARRTAFISLRDHLREHLACPGLGSDGRGFARSPIETGAHHDSLD